MAALLAQYESIKSSSGRIVVCIEDVSDAWGIVREGFEARVPFRKAWLNSKARHPVIVDELPVDYILTTDSRLRSRVSYEPSPFLFRQPYATVVLVTCEDFDEYKAILKPRLRTIVQNEDREWLIVFVSKAHLSTDHTGKLTRRIYSKLEVDFSSKKRERCCKLDMHVADAAVWEDVESKMVECIRLTLDRRVQFYEEEVRKLSENRLLPSWSFCNFFIMKESLAFMFEMTHMQDDALREYDELEQCFTELVNVPLTKSNEFGGLDPGDDCTSILQTHCKALNQIVHDEFFREFDFRQYLFSRQALLLFQLNRPVEVAARGFFFVIFFSNILSEHEKKLPFCLREVWVITACMSLVKETAERFTIRSVSPDMEKEFYRLQADLYSLARVKLMRLADLIGYGKSIQRSPCNSAALSMLPWPKPVVWPSVPADANSRILMKEQLAQDMEEPPRPFGISRKLLPVAPSLLLREANRRRASLSAVNTSEMIEYRLSSKESMVGDGIYLGSPPYSATTSPVRTNSGPLRPLSPGSGVIIDRPMKLAEIQAAAEHALHQTISDEKLRLSLSSVQSFEELYLEVTRLAADNYHRSWRKRHGVVLDGEVAALHYRCGNYDSAAKLYEKVCALYAGEGWHGLLAEVLPNLAECQKQLGHLSSYLQSCVKLLSLEEGLLLDQERHTLHSEILRLAHSALKGPVSVDVSLLITFSAKGGPPLCLSEGDPGSLLVSVWSGFPAEVSLDTLNLTLIATFAADEGTKVVTTSKPPLLKPGKNDVLMVLPPQRPGSYVLGVLTGQLGQIRLRSHTYCTTSAVSSKGGSPESDDYLSLEKPLRPVLQVAKPRALIDIAPVVSWGLLMGEPQWLGLIIKPIDYSFESAILHLSAGPGLCFDDPQQLELEIPSNILNDVSTNTTGSDEVASCEKSSGRNDLQDKQFLELKNGAVTLPDDVTNTICIVWICVRAVPDKTHDIMPDGAYLVSPKGMMYVNGTSDESTIRDPSLARSVIQVNGQSQSSISESPHSAGLRKLDVRFEFGAGHGRIYERTVSVQFLEPLRTVTRVVSKGNESSILLQVILISQLNATITIIDAHLDLQSGYAHTGDTDGKPSPSSILPLVLSPSSESALLFMAHIDTPSSECDEFSSHGKSVKTCCQKKVASTLHIHYEILGDRNIGAHSTFSYLNEDVERGLTSVTKLVYRCNLALDMPVVEPLLAVGMLALPSDNPRVGHQFLIRWRIERLKEGFARSMQTEAKLGCLPHENLRLNSEQLFYEIDLNPDNWMIAGRKKGYICLPLNVSGRVIVSIECVPLVAGYVRPPALSLPYIDRAQISCTPPGPHLICVLPPSLSSTFCVAQRSPNFIMGS